MPSPLTTEAVTIHFAASDRAALEEMARASDRDTASLVTEAVVAYLDIQRWHVAHIREGVRQADANDFASEAEVEAAFAPRR